MADWADPEPLELNAEQHCMHDPKYETGAYYCHRPRGHRGHHVYVPDFLAVIAPIDAPAHAQGN